MRITEKKQLALSLLVLVPAMTCVMQWTQQYRFYAKEAEHLWLNDTLWMAQHFEVPGGLSQLITSFLTQFYCLPWVGAFSQALIFGLIIVLGCSLVRHVSHLHRISFMTLWLLPVGFLALCHEHSYYNLKGNTSFLLAMIVSWFYVRVSSRLIDDERRHCTTLLCILSCLMLYAVYWCCGSAAVLLLAVIVIFEFAVGVRLRSLPSAITISSFSWVSFIALVGHFVKQGYYTDMEEALTPAQYYEWPSTYFFPLYAWMAVPVILLLSVALRDASVRGRRWFSPVLVLAGLAVSSATITAMYQAVHSDKVTLLRQDEWMARRQDWDGIIEAHKGLKQPTPFISYLNLALAQKGQLVQRMMEFNPMIAWSDEAGMYSPVFMTQDELSRDALKLQSSVCMAWGGAALCNAQKAAFESNFLTPGSADPIELQRLVLTNTVFETPETARKYLRRLSRTTFYRDWANNLLAHPEELARQAEALRGALPPSDEFYMKTQLARMLRQIAMQTPDNKVAAQFYETYLIQSQDTTALRHWREFVQKN